MKRLLPLLALLMAGCATTPPPKEVEIIAGAHLPPGCTVIGQARGYSLDDLENQARARGGDAITIPTYVSLRGLLQSDVLKRP